MPTRPLNIFVQRASECLTDHVSHGDGLICFSLLNGLAARGHTIYAYADGCFIKESDPRLHVRAGGPNRLPANSLAPWEHAFRADWWLRELERSTSIDLVWRMQPFENACPTIPYTGGRPLVLGPMFYGWPEKTPPANKSSARGQDGVPRFGVGLGRIVRPLARRGWRRSLSAASLILCATEPHAQQIRSKYSSADVAELPVIVEPPADFSPKPPRRPNAPINLVLVANLVAQKNPLIFCQTVKLLNDRGVPAHGTLIGDGPERPALEGYARSAGIEDRLQFAGKIPNTEVYDRVRCGDLLLSISQGEPYGRGIVEAMSVGTPCVCHRSGGPADFIRHGEDGLLVNELSAEAYTDAIATLLSDPTALPRLSHATARRAEAWSSDVVLTRLEELLMQTLSRTGARVAGGA